VVAKLKLRESGTNLCHLDASFDRLQRLVRKPGGRGVSSGGAGKQTRHWENAWLEGGGCIKRQGGGGGTNIHHIIKHEIVSKKKKKKQKQAQIITKGARESEKSQEDTLKHQEKAKHYTNIKPNPRPEKKKKEKT